VHYSYYYCEFYCILHADDVPGFICNQSKEIHGVKLESSHRSLHNESLCVVRFVTDDNDTTGEQHLMLNFEEFNISDPGVELKILGTSDSDVRFFHCAIVYCFGLINLGLLSFDILKVQIRICSTVCHILYTIQGAAKNRTTQNMLSPKCIDIFMSPLRRHIFVCFMAKLASGVFSALAP